MKIKGFYDPSGQIKKWVKGAYDPPLVQRPKTDLGRTLGKNCSDGLVKPA